MNFHVPVLDRSSGSTGLKGESEPAGICSLQCKDDMVARSVSARPFSVCLQTERGGT